MEMVEEIMLNTAIIVKIVNHKALGKSYKIRPNSRNTGIIMMKTRSGNGEGGMGVERT